jgi:hypothetical protein
MSKAEPDCVDSGFRVCALRKKGKLKAMKGVSKEDPFLVEFKAPRELVALFDAKLSSRFSSRSEALRTLMRAFVDDST